MRLTAPTSTAHIGQVEIRGVQRVMEFEATDFHHHHHHAGRPPTRRGQRPSQAVSPSELGAVQSRTVIVVPCKDEPLDRIMSVWAGIPPGSLIMSVSGSATAAAYAAERDALAGFCRDTGRSGMCVWQRDPALAAALRAAGLTALLDGGGDGLVHKGKGEALVIGIALAAVARGPDGSGFGGAAGERQDCGIGGGRDQEMRCGDDGGRGGQQDTTSTIRCRGDAQENVGGSRHRGRSRGACQRDGGDGGKGGKGGGGGVVNGGEGEEETSSRNGTRTGFYKYIGFVDADNFVPGSVQEYCKAFSSGLHLASAEDAMVRISWGSKPKIKDGNIEFKKSGRSSEIVNRWFNRLLREMGGDCCGAGAAGRGPHACEGVEGGEGHICTGNAGEHAMTISLALKLRLASGYAIEPFHFLDIFERFAGDNKALAGPPDARRAAASPPRPASLPELGSSPASSMSSSPLPTPKNGCSPEFPASSPAGTETALENFPTLPLPPPIYKSTPSSPAAGTTTTRPARGRVQILQVRTMNPHFHDTSKGESHIAKMWMQGLSAIYHSPVTARLHEYREALWATILEGKNKLEGGAAAGAEHAGDWEPEQCRIYPAPADFDLLKFRDMLEASEGSFWWSGMDDEEDEDEDEEDEEDEEEEEIDDLPQKVTHSIDFGLDGYPDGRLYRTQADLMDFLQGSSSPSGELPLELPPVDSVQHGAFQGRQDFPHPQRDFGMERAGRNKLPRNSRETLTSGISCTVVDF